jgi:hypothetical protein
MSISNQKMSIGYDTVHCDLHGDRRKAYVCSHLLHGVRQGFVTVPEEELTNPYPDAWCYKCESIRQEFGGEWSQENESLITVKLVCGDCYEEIKEKNLTVRNGQMIQ